MSDTERAPLSPLSRDLPAERLDEMSILPPTTTIFTPTGLSPAVKDLSITQWCGIISLARAVRESAAWVIGDVIIRAETEHGEMYSQAISETGLSYDRLSNIVSVCRAWPPASRVRGLPFRMAEILAPVMRKDPARGAEMAEKAVAEGWGVEELRAALGKSPAPSLQRTCPSCGAVL